MQRDTTRSIDVNKVPARGKLSNKQRSQSESPAHQTLPNFSLCPTKEKDDILSADIYSWKIRKESLKWIVDKRYSQFRDLRREIKAIKPELASVKFPKKNWFFNLSKKYLKARQLSLNAYINQLISLSPQPQEISIFLEVEINASASLSIDGRGSIRRSLSFGSLTPSLSINDFIVLKVLGKGSFGKVYLVRPKSAPLTEVYAMKVLKKSEVIKRHQVEHTMTERMIMANVIHPFTLTLRYAFQTQDKLYMVTDYCQGGELFFHLKKLRRFTEGMMRFYSAQISLALSFLHDNFIIYRDLKPENVLLDSNGNIKLTDFGLSKKVSSFSLGTMESSTATFCGTPEYLSPEMILHRRNGSGYGKEVDWWSLGIVCFELLTGWPPFYDRDFNKMCEKILYKPLVFPVKKYNFTKEVEDLIKNLLHRDPNRRLFFRRADPNEINDKPVKTKPSGPNERNLRCHVFYNGTDWGGLEKGQVIPPFRPPVGRDVSDTRNFDKEFTKLTIKDSPPVSVSESEINKAELEAQNKEFEGFAFPEVPDIPPMNV